MNPYSPINQSEIDRQIAARNAGLNAQPSWIYNALGYTSELARAMMRQQEGMRNSAPRCFRTGTPLGALAPYLRTILK